MFKEARTTVDNHCEGTNIKTNLPEFVRCCFCSFQQYLTFKIKEFTQRIDTQDLFRHRHFILQYFATPLPSTCSIGNNFSPSLHK